MVSGIPQLASLLTKGVMSLWTVSYQEDLKDAFGALNQKCIQSGYFIANPGNQDLLYCFFDIFWTGVKQAHTGLNPAQLSHQIGRDLFDIVSTLFLFTKAGQASKIGTLLRDVDPMVFLLKQSGKGVKLVQKSANRLLFEFDVQYQFFRLASPNVSDKFPVIVAKDLADFNRLVPVENMHQVPDLIDQAIVKAGGFKNLPVDENGVALLTVTINGQQTPILFLKEQTLANSPLKSVTWDDLAKGGATKGVGHLTPWSQMTKAEARAFQHSYSRHASELGLPNWSQTKAGELQGLFNNAVSNIRNVGSNSFFRSQELVNGVKTTVNRTEPIINGQKYFYYETLQGKFISAGKMP